MNEARRTARLFVETRRAHPERFYSLAKLRRLARWRLPSWEPQSPTPADRFRFPLWYRVTLWLSRLLRRSNV